jgi:hypothetical protein
MKKSLLDFQLLDNETSMLSGNVEELSPTSDKYGRGLQKSTAVKNVNVIQTSVLLSGWLGLHRLLKCGIGQQFCIVSHWPFTPSVSTVLRLGLI